MTETLTDLILRPLEGGQLALPLLSSRNCTQMLRPIPQGKLRRTVNGDLVHTGLPSHTKYHSLIKGDDKAPPAFENIWTGAHFEVGCLAPLTQSVEGGTELRLNRPAVEGSVRVEDQEGTWHVPPVEGLTVTLPPRAQFVTYRPVLSMAVVDHRVEADEWGMTTTWSLMLEEV